MDEGGTGLVDKIETLKCSMTKERKAGRERQTDRQRQRKRDRNRERGASAKQRK